MFTRTFFEHSKEIAVFRLDGREVSARLNPRFGDPGQLPILVDCSGEMETLLSVQPMGKRQVAIDVAMVGDDTVESAAYRKEQMPRPIL